MKHILLISFLFFGGLFNAVYAQRIVIINSLDHVSDVERFNKYDRDSIVYMTWVDSNESSCLYIIERKRFMSEEYDFAGFVEGYEASIPLFYSWKDLEPSHGEKKYRIRKFMNCHDEEELILPEYESIR